MLCRALSSTILRTHPNFSLVKREVFIVIKSSTNVDNHKFQQCNVLWRRKFFHSSAIKVYDRLNSFDQSAFIRTFNRFKTYSSFNKEVVRIVDALNSMSVNKSYSNEEIREKAEAILSQEILSDMRNEWLPFLEILLSRGLEDLFEPTISQAYQRHQNSNEDDLFNLVLSHIYKSNLQQSQKIEQIDHYVNLVVKTDVFVSGGLMSHILNIYTKLGVPEKISKFLVSMRENGRPDVGLNIEWYNSRISLSIQNGDSLKDIENLFSSIPETLPKTPHTYSIMINYYIGRKMFDKAKELHSIGVQELPDNAGIRNIYLKLLHKQKDFDKSLEAFRGLVQMYHQAKEHNEKIKINFHGFGTMLTVCKEHHRYDVARKVMGALRMLTSPNDFCRLQFMMIQHNAQDWDGLLAEFQDMQQELPNFNDYKHIDVLYYFAMNAAYHNGLHRLVESLFEESFEIVRHRSTKTATFSEIVSVLMNVKIKEGKYEEALHLFQKYRMHWFEKGPYDKEYISRVYNSKLTALVCMKDYQLAHQFFNEFTDKKIPKTKGCWEMMVGVFEHKGLWKNAMEASCLAVVSPESYGK